MRTRGTVIAGTICAMASSALAGGHGEIAIGRTAANRLVAEIGFATAQIPGSIFPGFAGYASALIGFADVPFDDVAAGVYMLSPASNIRATLTHVDPGVLLYDGLAALAVGQAMEFGPPPFDYHPIYDIPSLAAHHGHVFTLRFVLHDSTGLYADSAEFTLSMTPACAGDYNLDGEVNIGDIFDFLAGWFAGDTRANFDGVGGLTVQDIFGFLGAWFAACP